MGTKMAFFQERFSTTFKMTKRKRNPVKRNPILSTTKIYPKISRATTIGRFHLAPFHRVEILAWNPCVRKDARKTTMKAIKQTKQPAVKAKKPEPGSLKFPNPRLNDPKIASRPMVPQKRPLI